MGEAAQGPHAARFNVGNADCLLVPFAVKTGLCAAPTACQMLAGSLDPALVGEVSLVGYLEVQEGPRSPSYVVALDLCTRERGVDFDLWSAGSG